MVMLFRLASNLAAALLLTGIASVDGSLHSSTLNVDSNQHATRAAHLAQSSTSFFSLRSLGALVARNDHKPSLASGWSTLLPRTSTDDDKSTQSKDADATKAPSNTKGLNTTVAADTSERPPSPVPGFDNRPVYIALTDDDLSTCRGDLQTCIPKYRSIWKMACVKQLNDSSNFRQQKTFGWFMFKLDQFTGDHVGDQVMTVVAACYEVTEYDKSGYHPGKPIQDVTSSVQDMLGWTKTAALSGSTGSTSSPPKPSPDNTDGSKQPASTGSSTNKTQSTTGPTKDATTPSTTSSTSDKTQKDDNDDDDDSKKATRQMKTTSSGLDLQGEWLL